MADEQIRLILDVKGGGAVKDLQENLAYTRATLGQLKAAYEAGQVTTEDYLKTGGRLARQEQELANTIGAVENAEREATIAAKQATAEMERATIAAGKQAAAQDQVAVSTGKATGKMAGLGQAGLQTGRVIQDFTQGGIGGVLNNIEGFAMAVGGGPGLAGALTGLGVAIYLVKPHIEEFVASLKPEPVEGFKGSLNLLQDKLKELTDKPHKMLIDLENIEVVKERIKEVQQGLAGLETLKSGRTPEEKAAGDRFNKTFSETGREGKAALEEVERQLGDAYVANDGGVRDAQRALNDRKQQQATEERALKKSQEERNAILGSGDADAIGAVDKRIAEQRQEIERLKNPEKFKELADVLKVAQDNARDLARNELFKTMTNVGKGNDPLARDIMAERFRAAGQDRFARMVEQSVPDTPAQAAAREHAIEQGKERERLNKKKLDDIAARPALNAANVAKDAKATFDDAGGLIDLATKQGRDLAKDQKKNQLEAAHHQVGRQIEREDASIKGGGYDVLATAEAARTRANGGAYDDYGRFHPMTPEQQVEHVRREVEKQLRARNRRMDPDQAHDVSTKVALNATANVGQQMTSMGASMLDNQSKLMAIVQKSQSDYERLMQVVHFQGQQISQMHRKAQARSRTALSR